MYDLFRGVALRLIKAPLEPPDPPAGSRGSVEIFRASKRLLTLQLLSTAGLALVLLPALVVLIGVVAVTPDAPVEASIAIAVVFLLVVAILWSSYMLIRLDYEMRYYIVTDRSLRIREGALEIHEHTYTFANIQNLTIEQGPVERILGIANLRIQTAGGGGAEPGKPGGAGHGGTLRGIDDAEKVRDRILGLLKAYRDAGLGDDAPRPTASAISAAFVARLGEVRDEVRSLGEALAPSRR